MNDTPDSDRPAAVGAESIAHLQQTIEQIVLGQADAIQLLIAGYAASGHVMLEGTPGVGKTLLARSFAAAVGGSFARIQFTPDLMPADVVGSNILLPGSSQFEFLPGPIFHDVLLADEINRTPPKTQAALLEGMQEGQATIDGVAHPLPEAFFVVATQNPLEFEGVYPLPEAQLDRFLLRIRMLVPSAEHERALLQETMRSGPAEDRVSACRQVIGGEELRGASRAVHVRDDVLDYGHQLALKVRESPHVELGPSPRAVLALLEVARGLALTEERDFVIPDDVKRAVQPCWAHRVRLLSESELENQTPESVLSEVSDEVAVPH